MNDIYYGYDHAVRDLIPEANIVQHRLDYELDFDVPDEVLRHNILFTKFHHDLYTNSLNLNQILTQCRLYNIVPIIALNFFWLLRDDPDTKHLWVSTVTPQNFARCAKIVADLIVEFGFKEAYVSVLNEPTKWLTNQLIYHYSKATLDALTDEHKKVIKVLVGNDEFFPDMFDYLAIRFAGNPSIIIGYHALSSMGTWEEPLKFISRIGMMKGLANNYALDIMANESGSWFVNYRTKQGHTINLKIARECKQFDYLACNTVLPDVNVWASKNWRTLGYRIWDTTYTKLSVNSSYFNDWIDFIKEEGTKKMTEYNVPDELAVIAEELGNVIGNYEEGLPVLTGTGIWQNAIGHKRGDYLLKADFDAAMEKILKIIGLPITVYYNEDGSWNPKWREIAQSNPE